MEDGAVREACATCIHRMVCKHKETYLSLLKSNFKVGGGNGNSNLDFVYFVNPECKYYNSTMPHVIDRC